MSDKITKILFNEGLMGIKNKVNIKIKIVGLIFFIFSKA